MGVRRVPKRDVESRQLASVNAARPPGSSLLESEWAQIHRENKDLARDSLAIGRDIVSQRIPLLDALELDGKVYLDLGCGWGRTLLYVLNHKAPPLGIGVDISSSVLEICSSVGRALGLSPVLLKADLTDRLPLADNSVDTIFSSGVMLHLDRSTLPSALREVRRILRPGGRAYFVFSFLNRLSPLGIQNFLIGKLFDRWLSPTYVRTYTHGEVESLFVQVGFTSVALIPSDYVVIPTSLCSWHYPGSSVAKGINRQFSVWFKDRLGSRLSRLLTGFIQVEAAK